MSGVEALAGACAIFQTISFAKDIFNLCYSFYNDKPVAFDKLKDHAAGMEVEMSSIRRHAESMQQQRSAAGSVDDQEFITVLKKAGETAAQLRDEVAYVLERRQSGSVLKALRTNFRYHKRKSAIDGLKSDMDDCDRRIRLMLSNRDAQSLNALSLQTSTGFANLSDEVKGFIQKLADRQREDQKILEAKFVDLDAHVTQGYLETQNFVDDRISQRTAREECTQAHQRLIDSLYFPEMFARENRIDLEEASFEEAFHFEDADDSDTDQPQEVVDRSRTNPVQPKLKNSSEKISHDLDTELQQLGSSSDNNSFNSDASSSTNSSHSYVRSVTEEVKAEVSRLRTWIDTGKTPFWISGHAGSGKSTLVKFLAREESHYSKANPEFKREVSAHYFWKADSLEMQRSKRGCFCSLLYQMLRHDRKRCRSLLDQSPELGQKNSFQDWSTSELQKAFRYLIKGSSTTFVFFLDGLDEAGEDGEPFPILEMIELQSQLPNTRFCVSSRPETILKQRLEHNPTIVVQDLNYKSMMVSTRRKLGPVMASNKKEWTTSCRERLFFLIVEKADGIFLWLELVTNILRRDISQGEDHESVHRRLDNFPSKLIPLFTDMWERIGPDFASNQKRAASLINYVLLNQHIVRVRMDEGVYRVYRYKEGPPLSTVILFAVYSEEADGLFGTKSHTDLSDLIAWLEARQHHIATYCMGLLVCSSYKRYRRTSKQDQERTLDLATRLEDLDLFQQVSFVHRSAYDYFTETEEGRRICSLSALPYDTACMSLARAHAFYSHLLAEIHSHLSAESHGWSPDNLTSLLIQSLFAHGITALVQAAGSDKEAVIPAKDTITIFANSSDVLEMSPDFFTWACLHKSMLRILIEQCLVSSEVATKVLRYYWIQLQLLGFSTTSRLFTPPLFLTRTMIKLGADPHKVIPGKGLQKGSYTNAFGEYLSKALKYSDMSQFIGQPLKSWVLPDGLLAALDVFLKTNPKLDETIQHTLTCPRLYLFNYHQMFPFVSFKPSTPEDQSWFREHRRTFVQMSLDYLYVCEALLAQLSGSDVSALDPSRDFFSLLADVRQHLAHLQELQGLRKSQPRVLLGLSIAEGGKSFSWRTNFDTVSTGIAAECVSISLISRDRRAEEPDQLVNTLMWTDGLISGSLDSDGKRKFFELPESVKLQEWSQRSAEVQTMTWDEACKCAEGKESPDIPFNLKLRDDGYLELRSKEYA